MRKFTTVAALFLIAFVVACGGDESDGTNAVSGGSTDNSGLAFGLAGGEIGGVPEGVTVTGVGEVTAEPDGVLIRLTIGSGEPGVFDGSLPNLQLLDDEELDPVVAALREAGVDEKDITVNTFVTSPYESFGTGPAEITFRWNKPRDLNEVLDVAQDAVRRETDYGIQSAATVFTVDDCEALENQAREAALKDARKQAERVAELAGVTLGGITAIADDPFSLYGARAACDALEKVPSANEFVPISDNTSSSVTISVALRLTYAIQ